jgi:hypothetical protein
MTDITWRKLGLYMLGIVGLLIGLFSLLMLRRLYARRTTEEQQLYLKFCRKLEKAGVTRAAHEGPQDFAARATQARPQQSSAIAEVTALYVALRYGGADRGDELPALRRAVGAFKI